MLRELISAAVRRHVTDGTGVLLSGGIDSSTVAYFAPELPVFTGFYQGDAYDERPWARLISKDRDNFEIEITPQDFIDNIDAFLDAVKPPYEGPGGFGQYMVAKTVCNYVHTVLSGEGGDELFGGYASTPSRCRCPSSPWDTRVTSARRDTPHLPPGSPRLGVEGQPPRAIWRWMSR